MRAIADNWSFFNILKQTFCTPSAYWATLRYSLRRRANARNVSFRISLRWLTYIVNSVDKTKLSCNTPTEAAPQFFLETYPLYTLRYTLSKASAALLSCKSITTTKRAGKKGWPAWRLIEWDALILSLTSVLLCRGKRLCNEPSLFWSNVRRQWTMWNRKTNRLRVVSVSLSTSREILGPRSARLHAAILSARVFLRSRGLSERRTARSLQQREHWRMSCLMAIGYIDTLYSATCIEFLIAGLRRARNLVYFGEICSAKIDR